MPTVMRRHGVLWYGSTPVPATAMWTGELDEGAIRPCRHAQGRPALFAPERPGNGRPMFKNPHPVRQRRAMALLLCDVCARPLRNRTKHRISHAYAVTADHGAIVAPFQEPLVCGDCLDLAAAHCPFVSAERAAGRWPPLVVRRHRLVAQILARAGMALVCGRGDYPAPAVCYLKMEQLG